MEAPARSHRTHAKLVALVAACALACAGFVALGTWQLRRLAWKEELIARVDHNVHAAPFAAPGPGQWAAITPGDEYRRLLAQGRFDYAHEVLVAATTELGTGYWVITPLRTPDGAWLLVNRGFVPPELRGQVPHVAQSQSVVGLLRFSEPGGRLLQHNDPAADRWYSRDVASIAATKGLTGAVAPYFLDAVAEPGAAPSWPRPGLTVLRFPNDHLMYALTWFALAAMMAAALGYVLLDDRRRRKA